MPTTPINVPSSLLDLKLVPKNKTPSMNVKTGVKEFRAELKLLLISCCATAKRNAGMALPIKPTTAMGSNSDFLILLIKNMPKGNNVRQAKNNRNAAISRGEKTIRLFLIRIKELPQIIDTNIRITQL